MAANLHTSPKHRNRASVVYLHQLSSEDVDSTIEVMVCRKWDVNSINGKYLSTDFIVSDEKGNVMHCTVRNNISHCFTGKLQEGFVYSMRNFTVKPNKEEYRIIKDATYMIELDGSTFVKQTAEVVGGFIRYPFQFTSLEDIQPTEKKYLIDVIGFVTNVGEPIKQRTGANTLDFNLTNQWGRTIKVTLWGDLGDDLLQRKSHHSGICTVILTSMTAKRYMDKLCLSSTSSTLILDDDEIPAVKEFMSKLSDVVVPEEGSPEMKQEPRGGTIDELLQWARNRKKDAITFRCKVEITDVRTRNSWYYFACTSGKCKKGVKRQQGKFWCESCEKPVSFPRPRFRLQIDVKDDSAQTVIALFDDTAENLVNATAKSLLEGIDEDAQDSVLPHALTNLLKTTHIMEIKSNTYYEHETFESFTCTKVFPPEQILAASEIVVVGETLKEAASDETDVVHKTSLRRLKRGPSTSTPPKASEQRKRKIHIEEDSDSDVGIEEESNDKQDGEHDG